MIVTKSGHLLSNRQYEIYARLFAVYNSFNRDEEQFIAFIEHQNPTLDKEEYYEILDRVKGYNLV